MKQILLTLILIINHVFVEAAPTECDVEDNACMAEMLADISDSNDAAMLGIIVVGGGIFYLFNNSNDDKKDELIQSIKNGNGLPLIKSTSYDLSLLPTKKYLKNNKNDTFIYQGLQLDNSIDLDIIRFRYKFN